MNPDPDPQLERLVHEALRALPPRRAPATLAPRVLAAIAARQRVPWYRRAWPDWPRACQAAFFAFAAAVVGALYAGAWRLGQVEVATPEWLRPFVAVAEGLDLALKALWAAGEGHLSWILWGAVAVVATAGLMTVGLGAALVRLTQSSRA